MDYEQLGHILESIHPGVTIADSSGVFRFVSNSYLSGRSVKGSDIIGKFAGSEEMMKMFFYQTFHFNALMITGLFHGI